MNRHFQVKGALPLRKESPVPTECKAEWVEALVLTVWRREESLGPATN